MCQVGLVHTVGHSEETTRRLVNQFPAFVTMFQGVEQRIGSLMAQLVNDQLGEELVRLDGLLNGERELMSGAAERAQADATAERRRADTLEAQLEQAKAQAAAREAELERTLASERAATIRREREWNEARRRLEDDKAATQRVAAQLNGELQQRDEAQGLTGVQETVTLASALDAMSLRRFLIDQGLEASVQRAVVTCPSGISAAAVEAWRRSRTRRRSAPSSAPPSRRPPHETSRSHRPARVAPTRWPPPQIHALGESRAWRSQDWSPIKNRHRAALRSHSI